jgi:pyruvate formate lyase activating enzyme
VRKNVDGRLVSLNYGKVVALNVDPVEKKPLFHFLPGSSAFSIAASGCNFSCSFCQNSSISQGGISASEALRYVPPEEIVKLAVESGAQSIAHTYTEPTIYFEYLMEVARLSKKAGLKTLLVSNGFMSSEAAELLVPLIDGINIDLKFWSDDHYRKFTSGFRGPVCDNIRTFHAGEVLVEVTTLIIPGIHSDLSEPLNIAQFILSVDPAIPWHVSRFHPSWKMTDRPATSVRLVEEVRQIGLQEGHHYVYSGNISVGDGESTFCHKCGFRLIHRSGYRVVSIALENNCCPSCGVSHNFILD